LEDPSFETQKTWGKGKLNTEKIVKMFGGDRRMILEKFNLDESARLQKIDQTNPTKILEP
jgi:hypothetical protein